ncbi:DUF2971 domain-containing protein [Pseudomonas alliivorans]|nr:DUF2971 domain-containing protein [Pseudomonas alliivorans]
MKVEVLKSLHDDMVLWRYMSLDKFINLLDDEGLYFAPLDSYKDTDPFEGYPPAVALRAIYSLSDETYQAVSDTILMAEQMEKPWSPTVEAAVDKAHKSLRDRPAKFRLLIDALFKGTLVSCWYHSSHQSEAMWKMYGDQRKGVAIRTTVGKLKLALAQAQGNERQKTIFIGKVRYIDYSDPLITAQECKVDGHIIPLLKRISYSHENEVRAFLSPDLDASNVEEFTIKPFMASCDVHDLIEGVYVSPYTSMPFFKAVQAVAGKYGLACPVERSDLLSGADDLFRLE